MRSHSTRSVEDIRSSEVSYSKRSMAWNIGRNYKADERTGWSISPWDHSNFGSKSEDEDITNDRTGHARYAIIHNRAQLRPRGAFMAFVGNTSFKAWSI
jgi:hypothetical protein